MKKFFKPKRKYPNRAARGEARRPIRKSRFKSVFKFPPIPPPFVWFLTSKQTREAYGITNDTLATWRKSWRDPQGKRSGPQPVYGVAVRGIAYRWDEVTGKNFIVEMRNRRRAFVMSTVGPHIPKPSPGRSGLQPGVPRTADERINPARYRDEEVA